MINFGLVGGRVRTLFTNEHVPSNADYDVLVTNSNYIELLQYLLDNNIEIKLPEEKYINLILNGEFSSDLFDKSNTNWTTFKTGVIKASLANSKSTVDYVLARKAEEYKGNNIVPTGIIINENVTVLEDLSRRDFRINAMYLPLDIDLDMTYYDINSLVDPYNCLQDIKNKTINCVGDPFIRFMEDPSRILRLLKFMLRLNYNCPFRTLVALTEKEEQLIEAFITKMNVDRTSGELKHIFNNKYNSYHCMNLFIKTIPQRLGKVILNNELYLNPTVIDPKVVKKQAKWR